MYFRTNALYLLYIRSCFMCIYLMMTPNMMVKEKIRFMAICDYGMCVSGGQSTKPLSV